MMVRVYKTIYLNKMVTFVDFYCRNKTLCMNVYVLWLNGFKQRLVLSDIFFSAIFHTIKPLKWYDFNFLFRFWSIKMLPIVWDRMIKLLIEIDSI